jgi:hypothetical protein
MVSRSNFDNVVDDIFKLLEDVKGFSRRTLDVGGSTVAKSPLHSLADFLYQWR